MDREQRISCANPRRGQAGTGLRSRSRPLPGRGSVVASRGRTGDGCGRREGRVRASRTHASHPLSERAAQSSFLCGPFLAPAVEAGTAEGQSRAQGAGSEGLGPSRGFRDQGVGVGVLRQRSRRPLPSGPLLPPHLSHSARDLRPRIPGPRGTVPGTGRRRERYPEARRSRQAGAGRAALPGRCGGPAALCRLPLCFPWLPRAHDL